MSEERTPAGVFIKLGASSASGGTVIAIDGVEITKYCRKVTITSEAGHLTEVDLELVSTTAQIEIDDPDSEVGAVLREVIWEPGEEIDPPQGGTDE